MTDEDYKDLLVGAALGAAGLGAVGLGGHAFMKSRLGKRLARKPGFINKHIIGRKAIKNLESSGKINSKMLPDEYQPILKKEMTKLIDSPADYKKALVDYLPSGAFLGMDVGLMHALNKKNKKLEKKGSALTAYGLLCLLK